MPSKARTTTVFRWFWESLLSRLLYKALVVIRLITIEGFLLQSFARYANRYRPASYPASQGVKGSRA